MIVTPFDFVIIACFGILGIALGNAGRNNDDGLMDYIFSPAPMSAIGTVYVIFRWNFL
jgi:hypothetical protein